MFLIWLQEQMNQGFLANICNVNVNLMVESVIQIKNEIMINLNVSVKSIISGKIIIFAILIHVVVKTVNL